MSIDVVRPTFARLRYAFAAMLMGCAQRCTSGRPAPWAVARAELELFAQTDTRRPASLVLRQLNIALTYSLHHQKTR